MISVSSVSALISALTKVTKTLTKTLTIFYKKIQKSVSAKQRFLWFSAFL